MSSASSATDVKLSFPSQEEITDYLATHPRTIDVYKNEKKINEAVAKAFANSTRYLFEVQIGVMCTIENLYINAGANIEVRSTARIIESMSASVVAALIDMNKRIGLEKANEKP